MKQEGRYTVASQGTGKRDTAYFPWVGPNVVMVSIKPDHKDKVDAWWNQKGFGRSKVAAVVGKLDPKAAVAGAFGADKPLDSWLPVISAYGNWTVGGGKVSGALVATAVDANAAGRLAAELTKELERDIKKDRTPPSVKKIMRAISARAAGNLITIKGTVTEKDLGDAFVDAVKKKKKFDGGGGADEAQAIAKMDEYSKKMCACKDKACADKVNEAMTKWGTEMAKNPRINSAKPSPDLVKRATDIMTRYTECMTKVMMQKSP